MKELLIIKKYSIAFLTAFKKPAIAFPAIGMLTLSDCQMALIFLIGLMSLDFATGVLASWNIWKKSKIESNFWKKGFSSYRLRLSLVKSITYFSFILCAYGIESVFKVKSWKADNYTEHQITLTLLTIAISCAIEFYSIFFENLPKAGFSIEKKVKTIFSKLKSAISAIRSLRNGDNSST